MTWNTGAQRASLVEKLQGMPQDKKAKMGLF